MISFHQFAIPLWNTQKRKPETFEVIYQSLKYWIHYYIIIVSPRCCRYSVDERWKNTVYTTWIAIFPRCTQRPWNLFGTGNVSYQ